MKANKSSPLKFEYLGANASSFYRALLKFYDTELSTLNLTLSQALQIIELSKSNDNETKTSLSKKLLIERTTFSRMAPIIVSKGYITIEMNKSDRREKLVKLTESGKKKAKEAIDLLTCIDKSIEHELGKKGFNDICSLLDSLRCIFMKKTLPIG